MNKNVQIIDLTIKHPKEEEPIVLMFGLDNDGYFVKGEEDIFRNYLRTAKKVTRLSTTNILEKELDFIEVEIPWKSRGGRQKTIFLGRWNSGKVFDKVVD